MEGNYFSMKYLIAVNAGCHILVRSRTYVEEDGNSRLKQRHHHMPVEFADLRVPTFWQGITRYKNKYFAHRRYRLFPSPNSLSQGVTAL